MVTKMHRRYGGFLQLGFPTEQEELYDRTHEEIDNLEQEILGFPMRLFTAGEFYGFSKYLDRISVFPSQEQLDTILKRLKSLREELRNRNTP